MKIFMKRSLIFTLIASCVTGCQNPKSEIHSQITAPINNQAVAAQPTAQQCQVSAYIIDKDPKGLNIRSAPNSNAKVIKKLPTNTDGIIVDLVASQSGWLQVTKAESINRTEFKGKGWIYAQMLGTNTRGYDLKGVNIHENASGKSKVLGKIPAFTTVKLLNCNGSAVKVEYKGLTGWLTKEDQCPLPWTTCS